MRRRITFAIVGAVIAALVIAGAGTFVLDRLSARETTRRELERQSQALIAILDDKGHQAMAEVFLNSGHAELRKGAEDWAARNGFTITAGGRAHGRELGLLRELTRRTE